MKTRRSSALKCPQDYYDVYSISFPIKALGRIQRNKYICSELEKLHPCFSDDCCFDSKIRFSKGGLKADVVVMQKFRLAEYKNQNNQKPVYIEEFKKLPFFKDFRYKQKLYTFLIASVLILLLIFVVAKLKHKQGPELAPVVNNSYDTSVDVPEQKPFSNVQKFFESVSLYDGKVLQFFWELNGFSQNLSLTLKNVYPETVYQIVPDARILSVTYENNIPLMTVQLNTKVSVSTDMNDIRNHKSDFAAELREFVLHNDFNIIEETVNPYGIKLQLPVKSIQENNSCEMFNSLFQFVLDKNLYASSLSIKPGSDYLYCSISFSNVCIKDQTDLYKSLIENSKIFFETSNNQKEIDLKKSKSSHEKSNQKSEQSNVTDIGKIIRTDGTTIEFYKDENGRIKQK